MVKIFVSYSSKDRERARGLVEDLEGIGHEVWFDQELSGGQVWWDRIMASLRDCDLVIFALSPHWLNSYASGLEFDYATALGKNRLPVAIDAVDYPLLPTKIQKLQIVDYRNPDRASVTKLARALTHMPAPAPLPDPLPTPPRPPISQLADIAQRLSDLSLELDEQRVILEKIEGMLAAQSQTERAIALLVRLRNHPDASKDIVREVDELLERYHIGEERAGAPARGRRFPLAAAIALGVVLLIVAAGISALLLKGQGEAAAQPPAETHMASVPASEATAASTATEAPTPTLAPAPLATQAPAVDFPILALTGSTQNLRLAQIDPADGAMQTLTENQALDYYPVWSPGGGVIALGSWALRDSSGSGSEEGVYSVALLNLAERSLLTIESPEGAEGAAHLAWSPDGSRFAYWCRAGLLCIASAADGSVQAIEAIEEDATRPRLAWSPNGASIAYACEPDNENADLCLVSVDSGSVKVLVLGINDEVSPLWTSDGMALLYASSWDPLRPASTGRDAGIYRFEIATSQAQLLLAGQAEQPLDDLMFSADESWIAFSSGFSGAPELWVMAADGSNGRMLEDRFDEQPRALWSPGANRLLYVLRIEGTTEIFSINPAGGNPVNLTNHVATDERPVWSPDGTRIAFISNRDGQRELYVMNADGSGLMRLTNSPEDEFSPVWGP